MTAAAVIERQGRFLFVEERERQRIVINQPAGHLEHGESLPEAVRREVREETGFGFEPQALVGVYLYPKPGEADCSYLRFCFHGVITGERRQGSLDEDILRTCWLSRQELFLQRGRLRSPMVLRCVDDYLAGRRYPLHLLEYIHNRTAAGSGDRSPSAETGRHEQPPSGEEPGN